MVMVNWLPTKPSSLYHRVGRRSPELGMVWLVPASTSGGKFGV